MNDSLDPLTRVQSCLKAARYKMPLPAFKSQWCQSRQTDLRMAAPIKCGEGGGNGLTLINAVKNSTPNDRPLTMDISVSASLLIPCYGFPKHQFESIFAEFAQQSVGQFGIGAGFGSQ